MHQAEKGSCYSLGPTFSWHAEATDCVAKVGMSHDVDLDMNEAWIGGTTVIILQTQPILVILIALLNMQVNF